MKQRETTSKGNYGENYFFGWGSGRKSFVDDDMGLVLEGIFFGELLKLDGDGPLATVLGFGSVVFGGGTFGGVFA